MNEKNERLAPEDWIEISTLYAYYNQCSDTGDAEGYASCFTPDGIMDQVTRKLVIKGYDNLVEYKKQDVAGRGGKYRRHWNGGLVLRKLADGTVHGSCYLHAYNGAPGGLPVLQAAGVYEDRLVKVDGAWKFALRKLTMDARV
jgi:hypothetical protein